jgi:hypothetical protein
LIASAGAITAYRPSLRRSDPSGSWLSCRLS